MTEVLYLLTLCLPLGTVLIIFAMRYASAVGQAKARLDHDDAYRRLAQQAAGSGAETAAALSSIQAALAEVAPRLAAIEKILKAVE
jgi:hypothetical protein